MTERTEDAALSRILPVAIGDETVELRTLTIVESDAWLGTLAESMATVELPESDEGTEALRSLLTESAANVARLVDAYDLDHKLGGLEAIRARMSKRELRAAMDAMVTAEDPFGEGAARSVAAVFGAPSNYLAAGMRLALARMSRLAPSTAGPSDSAPTGPPSSEDGAASSSSSAGSTTTTRPVATKRSG